MESILETASNALLITLFVIIVYILYKRMIVFMNKKSETGVYLEVLDFKVFAQEKISVKLNIPEETTFTFSIEDIAGVKVVDGTEQTMATGEHTVELSTSGLAKGKYCMLLQSSNSKNTRFFLDRLISLHSFWHYNT